MVKKPSLNHGDLLGKSKDGVDWISELHDELLCRILSSLTTKESVGTSLLSERWKSLWSLVPALELETSEFENESDFWDFFGGFMGSNKDLELTRFKLIYDVGEHRQKEFARRINDVIKRKVSNLNVVNLFGEDLVRMPLSLYTCPTLVNLKLYCVVLDAPKSAQVSLPCLKVMTLKGVKFDAEGVMQTLISSCSVLEELVIVTHSGDKVKVIRVRSQSLKSFKLKSKQGEYCDKDEHPGDPDLEIDAPRLEYMSIRYYQTGSFIIHNIGPLANANIDCMVNVGYDDPLERTMMRNILTAISTVGEMMISARTLEMIDEYGKLEPVPKFHNLSSLEAYFLDDSWELLQTFLGYCPKVQSLDLHFECLPKPEAIDLSYVPQCFSSSLQYVGLKTVEKASDNKLAMYFLWNCVVLKALKLSVNFEDIMWKIIRIPRRSRECQFVMLKSD